MSKLTMFDRRTGNCVGECEIPDDVIEAAAKVETWMRTNSAESLHGLRLDGFGSTHVTNWDEIEQRLLRLGLRNGKRPGPWHRCQEPG